MGFDPSLLVRFVGSPSQCCDLSVDGFVPVFHVGQQVDQRERRGRTQQQTGSSLQDQMLRLPGFLHW